MTPYDTLVWGGIACDALITLVALFSIIVAYRSVNR